MNLDQAETRMIIAAASALAGAAGMTCVLAAKPRRFTPASVTLLAAFVALVLGGILGFEAAPFYDPHWSAGFTFGGAGTVLVGALLTITEARSKERAFLRAVAESEGRRRELERLGTTNVRLEDELQQTKSRLSTVEQKGGAGDQSRSARDLLQRKALETAQAAERRYKSIFESAVEGMATLERETLHVVGANPAMLRMAGLDAETLMQRSFVDLCTLGENPLAVADLQRCARERGALDVVMRRDDGGVTHAQVTVTPMGGGDAQLLVVVRDVSGRRSSDDDAAQQLAAMGEREKRAESERRAAVANAARLEEANARLTALSAQKDHFVSTVSHELRTPLTSITSFTEILLNHDEVEPVVRREFLEIIQKESARLTRLVSGMLDLARIEAGQGRLDLTEFDVRDVIADAVASVSGIAVERGVDVRVKVPSSARLLYGDRDKVQQLAINLIANAVKFSPEGAEVQVHVRDSEKADRIEISVVDRGPGIPPADLERIFEKFRRSDEGGARDVPGTGLGLAICREIAGLHGGRVWAESSPGSGATLRVELPTAEAGRRFLAAAGAKASAPKPDESVPVASPIPHPAPDVGRLVSVGRESQQRPKKQPATALQEASARDAIEWSTTGSLPPLRAAQSGGSRDAPPATGELPPIR